MYIYIVAGIYIYLCRDCLLPNAYRLLAIGYCLLPMAYCLLPNAYLPIAYCGYCLFAFAHAHAMARAHGMGIGNRQYSIGIIQQAIGNRQQAVGNRHQATGNRAQANISYHWTIFCQLLIVFSSKEHFYSIGNQQQYIYQVI